MLSKGKPDMSDSGTGRYVPPHKRGKSTVTPTQMSLGSEEADALRSWLESLHEITIAWLQKRNGGRLHTLQISQRIMLNDISHPVRFNVHIYERGVELGSTWMSGVEDVSITAQDNPRSQTFMDLWKQEEDKHLEQNSK